MPRSRPAGPLCQGYMVEHHSLIVGNLYRKRFIRACIFLRRGSTRTSSTLSGVPFGADSSGEANLESYILCIHIGATTHSNLSRACTPLVSRRRLSRSQTDTYALFHVSGFVFGAGMLLLQRAPPRQPCLAMKSTLHRVCLRDHEPGIGQKNQPGSPAVRLGCRQSSSNSIWPREALANGLFVLRISCTVGRAL